MASVLRALASAILGMKAPHATKQPLLLSVARTTAQTMAHALMESAHVWLTLMAMLFTRAMIAPSKRALRDAVSTANAPMELVYVKRAGRGRCVTQRCVKRV